MAKTKLKITIENDGKVVQVLEGHAVQVCVLQDTQSANYCYGTITTMGAAEMIRGMRHQEEYLKGKFDPLTIGMLLAIAQKAEQEENGEEVASEFDGVLN